MKIDQRLLDEALKDIAGIMKSMYVRNGKIALPEFDQDVADRMNEAGVFAVIEDLPNGVSVDYNPARYEWEVRGGEFEGGLAKLASEARQDRTAFKAIEALTRMYLSSGKAMPPEIVSHVIARLDGEKFPAREKSSIKIRSRDETIAMLVKYLVRKTGITPTRNDATSKKSGIDYVLDEFEKHGMKLEYSIGRDACIKHRVRGVETQ